MQRSFYYIWCFLLVVSCDFFKEKPTEPLAARVGEAYLTKAELYKMIPDGLNEADSILSANSVITRWATQQLLMEAAALNINEDRLANLNSLIEQYKIDLYTNAYKEALVKQKIDTSITTLEAEEIYNQNKQSFKLNEDLIKFRYIQIDETHQDIDDIKERLKEFNDDDKKLLDSIAIQFKSYSLNDSIWVQLNKVVEKIKVVTPVNKDELLKKSNFIERKDSLSLYLMQVEDVRLRNEIAPLEYVLPTIRQIVINERKLKFIKQLEKDITKDAIQNNEFEIYK
ncbi:MAG: peptidyl-prolyl cis-trans isomerase [bacterium]